MFNINKLFFFKDIDSRYVIYLCGMRFLIKHKPNIKFKQTTEFGLNKEPRNPQVIVSLTTYPQRINLVHHAINSILNQTMKADKVILWLEKEKFPNGLDDLPKSLLDLQQYGLTIEWCDTLRSYCKLVPALAKYPEDIIITIDDDSYYENNLIEDLYNAYLKNPKNIYSRRVVRLALKDGEVKSFTPRQYLYKDDFNPTYLNQLIGMSGVLYPPHSLHKDVLNINLFKTLIPTHDDVYFWAMALRNNTKIQLVDGHNANIYTVEGTQEFGLININRENNSGISLSDAHMLMVKEFPEILPILEDTNSNSQEEKFKRVSVVIPTLQKNLELLNNLVKMLDKDPSVSEIIIIDNAIKGYSFDSNKLRVITPKENLFVNPSWNFGAREAKEEIIALLNDDITIPEDFCKNVVSQMTDEMGLVGCHIDYVDNTPEIKAPPENTGIKLKRSFGRNTYFGIAMFVSKKHYYEIPEDIKIFWGDEWLYYQNEKHKFINCDITNQRIYHFGSLSSKTNVANPYMKSDCKLYKKYTKKWWQYVCNCEQVFRGFKLTILGLEFTYHWDKKH
jgi:hypothetical protein